MTSIASKFSRNMFLLFLMSGVSFHAAAMESAIELAQARIKAMQEEQRKKWESKLNGVDTTRTYENECPICYDSLLNKRVATCSNQHKHCVACAKEMSADHDLICGLCRAKMTVPLTTGERCGIVVRRISNNKLKTGINIFADAHRLSAVYSLIKGEELNWREMGMIYAVSTVTSMLRTGFCVEVPKVVDYTLGASMRLLNLCNICESKSQRSVALIGGMIVGTLEDKGYLRYPHLGADLVLACSKTFFKKPSTLAVQQ